MRRLIACALAIAIPSATIPGLARGDGIGVIAAGTAEPERSAAAMADAITGRSARTVEDAIGEARRAIAAGAVPIEVMRAFRRVRDQIDEGWRAYLRVAVELSAARLATARTAAENLLALPGGTELYADAALRLGAVLGHLGRAAESQAVLTLAIALDPDRPVTLAEFSPDVVDAVAAARAAPVAMHRVRVETSPAGALVRIDGKDVGRAPVIVELGHGQHVVVARSPLHEAATRGFHVTGDSTVELELVRDRDAVRLAEGAQLGVDEAAAQALVDTAVRYADLDEVVIVADTVRRGSPALLVQRCARLPVRCSAVAEIGYADRRGLAAAARSAWQAVLTAELRYPPTVLTERGGALAPGGGCQLCRSPWLWTGVGAAVVIGAAITWGIVSASKPAPIVGVDGNQWR
ncbi:MAG: PEGA domain-containing protein [Kofleriaceae bacterium]